MQGNKMKCWMEDCHYDSHDGEHAISWSAARERWPSLPTSPLDGPPPVNNAAWSIKDARWFPGGYTVRAEWGQGREEWKAYAVLGPR